jgi:hypothetical protein
VRHRYSVTPWLLSIAIVVGLGACSAAKQQPGPVTDGHRTVAEGYSLLYGITSQQRDLKKLLSVKVESDAVDAVISELADYTGELSSQLKDMTHRYPALTVDKQFLPVVEVKTREAISEEKTAEFKSTEGKDFERRLLLNQLSSLGQEKNMAKVMVELETADERRAFWRKTQQRFETLHGKVWRLLSEQYFSK